MKKILNLILITGFLLIIASPNLGLTLGISSRIDIIENRTLAPFPNLKELRLNKLPEAIMAYYSDNFGFRNQMIRMVQIIKFDYLHVPQPGFLYGKKGWSFVNPFNPVEPRPIFKTFYKNIMFTPTELTNIKNQMEADDRFFQNLSIPYFNIVVPDKEVIYPEFYPYPGNLFTDIRLNQLIKYLEANSSSSLVDLRQILIARKGKNLLYFKGDGHWNTYGVFFAYQEVMRRFSLANNDVYVPKLSDFEDATTKMPLGLVIPKKDFTQKKN